MPINTSDKFESFIMWDFLVVRQCYPCMTDCAEEEGKGLTQWGNGLKEIQYKQTWMPVEYLMRETGSKNWSNKGTG